MPQPRKKNEILYFVLRNAKLRIGVAVVFLFVVLALVGPLLTKYQPRDYVAPGVQPPSSEFWFGTTSFGEDVFTQFVYGLRATFIVGLIGGGLGTLIGILIGFIAGYRGGIVDEILNMFTNIVLVVPSLVVLLIIAAYLEVRGLLFESVFIGFFAWPWAARAIRSQTFSLRSRDFVDLARLSGMKPLKIIITEIAPNMMSYLLLVFILQFGGAILTAATLDFIGLGPTNGVSLGLMMNNAVIYGALILRMWWWFIPPGLAITAIVGGLYITNVGLDEIFNPKLREM
ncbi:ABC transporter permease [Candidatus Cryosericum terrychapinii]|jgi:peptide/nickel transport system permease protein|uniref:ABC transporter permease n=1 Tax=Candidatus Cryosericum terrychapinii TaxID=2290919 RepID=A0A398D222_9BACT|nr:ABC transporter permease [Candidatus Cryosericum terrychapinii]RIE05541.1 ABC transporter permease [Candidatus Cryosericum terrychapinii]